MSAAPNATPTLGFWKLAEENRERLAIVAPDHTQITYGELYDLVKQGLNPPKVLFTSGYSARHIGREILDAKLPLLRKPWTLDELLRSVRDVLDEDRVPVGGTPGSDKPQHRFRRLTI